MLEKLELRDVGPAPKITVDFAPRLNILTGDNGLGKTFLLDVAWWALTRTWAGEPAWPKPGEGRKPAISYQITGKSGVTKPVEIMYRFSEQRWPLPHRRPPIPGLVLYARIDGGFSVWDPARNYWKDAPSLKNQQPDRPGAYHFTQPELWDGLETTEPQTGKPRILCNGLVRDWVSWYYQQSEAFVQLCEVLATLSPGGSEPLEPAKPDRVKLEDVRDIPFLAMPYGDVSIWHVSAGAKRIIALAYLLVWAWQEHLKAAKLQQEAPTDSVILLVDELESHLHPRWQRLILPALIRAVSKLNKDVRVQAITVTHAPLVLASVESSFDPEKDALFTMDLERDRIILTKLKWYPRGDANSWLISEVFDLQQPRSIDAERAIEKAMAAMRDPNIPLEQIRDIHRELHRVLKDTDPFWPRWVARAQKAGIEP